MHWLTARLAVERTLLAVYIALYIPTGFVMNEVGKMMAIAEFGHWWQVLTCYGLYLIPCSLLVRGKSLFDQYLHGLLFLGVLEFLGYGFGTSIAHEGNILDHLFSARNFTLAMTLFFAVIPPAGNLAAQAVHGALLARRVAPEPEPLRSQR